MNTIVEIERKTSRVWQGNYSKYMAEKDEWLRQQLKAYENQQRKIRAMEEAAQRFRIWGEMRDSDKMYARAKSMENVLTVLIKWTSLSKTKAISS